MDGSSRKAKGGEEEEREKEVSNGFSLGIVAMFTSKA